MKCVRVCVLRGVRGILFILVEVGFPQTHIWKVIRRLGIYSSTKCTWTGARAGSAEPGVQPTPPGAPRPHRLLAGRQVGPRIFPYVHYAWRARLLCQVGPLCKWVTPDAIFSVVVWRLLRVFVLFRSCSSEVYKTRKHL